jgi:hypothetical protein
MLYKVRATVDGHVYLQRPKATICAERPPYQFQLESGMDGRVLAASVSTRVPEETQEQFYSTLAPTPGGPAASHVTFSSDPVLYRQLLEQLQQLESVLALNFAFRREGNPLKRIRWHEAEEILVPETKEEEQRVHVFSMSVQRGERPERGLVSQQSFEGLVATAPRYDELTTLIAFWRVGNNHLDEGEFVNAFYNHYAVIEDLFADGKTGEGAVLRAFGDSDEFVVICGKVIDAFFGPNDRHRAALERFFATLGCERTTAGLQRFLFRIRGSMHHYFRKSSRAHPHPFNQDDYEVIALLVMYTATLALTRRVITLNNMHASA